MRFEQTRTILQQLAPAYHRQVSGFFQQLAEGEVSPRVRLMLDYLIDHEEHRALALGEFCHGAPHTAPRSRAASLTRAPAPISTG